MARIATRGIVARLKETAAELMAALSKGAWQCWVPTPMDPGQVAFVEALGTVFRVLDRETIDTRDRTGWSTTRLQLQRPEGVR